MEDEKFLFSPPERFIGAINLIAKQTEQLKTSSNLSIAEVVRKIDSLDRLVDILGNRVDRGEGGDKAIEQANKIRKELIDKLKYILGFGEMDKLRILPLFKMIIDKEYK